MEAVMIDQLKAKTIIKMILRMESDARVGTDEMREATLLLVWAYLAYIQGDKELPPLSSVFEGVMDLQTAYHKISLILEQRNQLSILGRYFRESSLPDTISNSRAIAITERANEFVSEDSFKLVADILYQDREPPWLSSADVPSALAELMFQLGDPSADEMYSLFSSSWPLAKIHSQRGKNVTLETKKYPSLMVAISLAYGVNLVSNDPITSPVVISSEGNLKQFPVVQLAQPYGLRIANPITGFHERFQSNTTDGVVLAIYHGLAQCSGKMIALIPQGLLFRGADNYELRVSLIDKGILDTVIQLPGKALENDASVSVALLIIDKQRDPKEPVMFYDAVQDEFIQKDEWGRETTLISWDTVEKDILERKKNDYSSFVKSQDIIDNGYDLSVRRYALNTTAKKLHKLPNTLLLSDVATILRAQSLKENIPPQGDIFHVVGGKDITESGIIDDPKQHLVLAGKTRDRAKLQSLQPDDILISIKGNIGVVGLVGKNCHQNWVANQIFLIIRLKENSKIHSPLYLFRYLKSPLIQAYLQGKVAGNSVQSLKSSDIQQLKVPIPTAEEEADVLQINENIMGAYAWIDEYREEIDELNQQLWGGSNMSQA